MCKPIHSQVLMSKPDLIEQIGGENQLDFLLISFCENINEDEELQLLFEHMGMDQLQAGMYNLVRTTFDGNLFDGDTRNYIILRNYAVFELGIDKSHFMKLKALFESAMRDSWIEEEILEECTRRFTALYSVFEDEGKDFERAAIAQKAVATKIMAASLRV